MQQEPFRIAQDETRAIATITLGRPEDGNKLMTHEVRGLGRAIREQGSRTDIKVVVIRAGGEHFCLGRQPDPPGQAPTTALGIRSGVTEPILDLYADVRATPVPVLAVVQGEAKGFGCAFVGQCDLAIASENAVFSMPEMDGNLPPKRLLHMVYTRDKIDAAEALKLGIVGEVVSRAALDAGVERLLSRLVDRKRSALCAVKEYMLNAAHLDAGSAARMAANILSVVLSSTEES
jgi:enoyl-CoA hydratase/carnithine racemase